MTIMTQIHSVSEVKAIRYMPGNGNAVTTVSVTTCGERLETTHYFHGSENAVKYFLALGGTDEMIVANPEIKFSDNQ